MTLCSMILRGDSKNSNISAKTKPKTKLFLPIGQWSVAQAGSNDEKIWGSKISLDCSFKPVYNLALYQYPGTRRVRPSGPAQCGACSWSIPTFCRYRESLIYPLRVTHLCSPTARCNVHNGSPSPGLIKFTTLGRPTAYSRYLYLLYVSNIRVLIYPSTLTDQQMVTYRYLCCRKPTLNALWPWPSRM